MLKSFEVCFPAYLSHSQYYASHAATEKQEPQQGSEEREPVLASFPVTAIKHPGKSKLNRERFVLTGQSTRA